MATIKPFKGLRPPHDLVERVESRPYDVLDSEEARVEAGDNEMSLYHIIKPEIDFSPTFRSGLGKFSVSGYKRVAYPAAKIKHFILYSISSYSSTPSALSHKWKLYFPSNSGNAFKYSLVTFGLPSSIVIAWFGQTCAHAPHPVHFSLSY